MGAVQHTETGVDAVYDRYSRLVQDLLSVPVALVTKVADDHQRFIGAVGLPEPWQTDRTTPLSHSFCQYVRSEDAPLVVNDAREIETLRDNLAIGDLGVVAYAGVPLRDAEGTTIGALCAIDTEPRTWEDRELAVLHDISLACTAHLRSSAAATEATAARERAERESRRTAALLQMAEAFVATTTIREVLEAAGRLGELVGAGAVSIGVPDSTGALVWHAKDGTQTTTSAEHWDGLRRAMPATPIFTTSPEALGPELFELLPAEVTANATGAATVLPLRVENRTIGLAAIVWSDTLAVPAADQLTLTALARYTSVALDRAQLLEARQNAAHHLQRSMLTEVPEIDGLPIRAVYRTAHVADEVGGDWYDVLELADGRVAVAVGDVAGHDIEAASAMGQLRFALRTLLWSRREEPAAILSALDDLNSSIGPDALTTVVLAILGAPESDGSRTLTWSNAGHLPPILQRSGQPAALMEAAPDLMLGVSPGRSRADHMTRLEPGDTFVLYTDGLVEQRDADVAERLSALTSALDEHDPLRPDEIARVLTDGRDRGDDVVLLTLRVDTAP
ncbi:SpoIIE family protein phosphatase [Aeromicrobium sp. YIM 150415]|uniref:GAF domain-containing SpoIIE family protein phosphatase n=1 Tax=Aeromicrobium sp. YIM 150415 TaxID=2803912 RepID=UPI0019654D6A|nr:SpoIIE family protein phosphatase [Aeromicrobium sp. YIM 150415]MBM9463942.1 SpoIIE family protein phosphatase [Aeromicrobium sp. YIM 150415]